MRLWFAVLFAGVLFACDASPRRLARASTPRGHDDARADAGHDDSGLARDGSDEELGVAHDAADASGDGDAQPDAAVSDATEIDARPADAEAIGTSRHPARVRPRPLERRGQLAGCHSRLL